MIMTRSKRIIYDERFKLEVLRDYYSSGMSASFISRKWGLCQPSLLFKWRKCYSIDLDSLSLSMETIDSCQMSSGEKSHESVLQQQILNLRKALEMEKLRSRAFESLLEIAEKEEGISILKKDGAKQ